MSLSADTAQAPEADGFRVDVGVFDGPFDLLLSLISKHQLDITEVALSTVTTEFIAYVRELGGDLEQTTQFLVVAATLLDLKTARLLPQADVEDEEDLALLEARDLLFARLMQYRAFKQVASLLADRLATEGKRYPRQVGLEPRFAALLPDDVTPAQAALAWVVAQDGVSTVIPGARNPEQARGNASAADVTLDASVLEGVQRIYDEHLREAVHPRW